MTNPQLAEISEDARSRATPPSRVSESDELSAAAITELSEDAQLIVWSMRHCMVSTLQERVMPNTAQRACAPFGRTILYPRVTALLLLAARDADRPLLIHLPCIRELSPDEQRIARVLAALTHGTSPDADWRALLGRQPSASLDRHARALADGFRASGWCLRIGV